MCLAEALLRIPDDDTRDALIRDKIGGGDWRAHLGHSPSLFVNAATWGLMLTGRLTATSSEQGLSAALVRLIGRGGEPLIRTGVNIAMRLMGEQFVAGQTIGEALDNARDREALGFRHSYDMLGEAAVTAEQADELHARPTRRRSMRSARPRAAAASTRARASRSSCRRCIRATAAPRSSACRPSSIRGCRTLAVLARRYDIGLNIDAEEADRLEISLDLLERLCFEPELEGWNGIGFVVQAYQKRALFVIDWLIDLARRRNRHRLMVRLVKGAYWDGEIKRAQLDGLAGYPGVHAASIHTDVSYLACARRLLAAPDAAFPQFATHNAHTLAAIHAMAGENSMPASTSSSACTAWASRCTRRSSAATGSNRPCRIYAPVGTHETLLAYLVRRLLENGANTSFVNQIADPEVTLDTLLRDPVEQALALQPVGAPHPRIAAAARPVRRAPEFARARPANEQRAGGACRDVAGARTASCRRAGAGRRAAQRQRQPVSNPADRRDVVGTVVEATPDVVDAACRRGRRAVAGDAGAARADCLRRAADLMEARLRAAARADRARGRQDAWQCRRRGAGGGRLPALLRGAASEGFANDTHGRSGVGRLHQPVEFPAVDLHRPGRGRAGRGQRGDRQAGRADAADRRARRGAAARGGRAARGAAAAARRRQGRRAAGRPIRAIAGVVFTGSTEVAQSINRQLAQRLNADGRPPC